MRVLLFGAGVLIALLFQRSQATAKDHPWLDQPRVEVEQMLKVTNGDEAACAEARGQLALAAGKLRRAAAEFRDAVAIRKARLEKLWARGRLICCSPDELELAAGSLAVARVGLAEAEGNVVALAELLPGVVHYHQRRIAFLNRLIQLGALDPREARDTLPQLNEALRAARARLKEVQDQVKIQKDSQGHLAP